jgi:trk system potassium uptake protein TrkA
MTRVAVIGLGRFGTACARRLYDLGAEVLGIDRSHAAVNQARDLVSQAVACDATDRANLEANDVDAVDVAVVTMGASFEASVLVTLHCREMGVERVVAKAVTQLQNRVLHEVGAHQVVMPEEEMGQRLADHVLRDSVVDFVELPEGFSLRRVAVPERWVGQTLGELKLLGAEQLNVVQIVRGLAPGEKGNDDREGDVRKLPLPDGSTRLEPGDEMDVIGPGARLDALAGG